MKIVIGVDPDSDKHGVAIYVDGNLCDLVSLSRVDLIKRAQLYRDKGCDVLFSIEDTSKNKGVWIPVGGNANSKVLRSQKVARDVGLCAQSMKELVLDIEDRGFAYKLHKISKEWKEGAGIEKFKQATKWTARSNKDTRSAAYFGWLECNKRF